MNSSIHKIRCFKCDLKRVWNNLRHGKVAKWTLIVHIVYYTEASTHYSVVGLPMILSAACAVALAFDLFEEMKQ